MAQPIQKPRTPFPAWRLPNGTINATEAQLEAASSSCERWEWGCAGLVVVGVVAAFLIAAIHPPYDSFLEQWGSAMAEALIAFGIVGEVVFSQRDAKIQTELRRRSNGRLTEALNRAANAEEELREFRRPRQQIFPPQKAAFVARLSAFKGTPFDAGTGPGGEVMHFWWVLAHALSEAGWVHLPWLQNGATVLNMQHPLPVSASVSATNVEIHLRQEHRGTALEAAAKELIAALGEAGIAATDEGFNVHSINHHAIHILVGPKA